MEKPGLEVPPSERYLMILGRLGGALIRDLDEVHIPQFIESQKKRGFPCTDQTAIDRYFSRNRDQDDAYCTLYAYDNLSIDTAFDRLFLRDRTSESIGINCSIRHVVYEAWVPMSSVERGHKHILFLHFAEGPPDCIQTYETWKDLIDARWKYGILERLERDTL
jgi:hypothetical protein